MALGLKIDSSAYNSLSADIKKEYVERDGSYHLDVTGMEDTGALKRAKDYEVKKRKEEQEKVAALESKLSDYESKTFDVTKLKAEWETENKKVLDGKDAQIKKLSDFGKKTLANDVALSLAKDISNAPELLLPHIASRFVADLDGDNPVTKILDKDGKPSKMTIEDLKNELLTDTRFAPILIASRARGGSVPQERKPGSADPKEKVDISNMKPTDLASRIEAKLASRVKK